MRRAGLLPGITALCLVTVGTTAPARDSGDALFIDGQGRVGIGTRSPRSSLDVRGTIHGIGMVPPGGIVLFSGNPAKAFDPGGKGRVGTPYEGWQLCNGNNGAPDLQDRFVVAAGRHYEPGATGGADSVILGTEQMPTHQHSGNTAGAGRHMHWIEGTDASGLAKRRRHYPGQTTVDMGFGGGKNADPNDTRWRGAVNTQEQAAHSHRFTTTTTGGGKAHENRPAYFALAFIMRLGAEED